MNIGERIRELRKSKNLTQKQLGDKIGVTAATITKYENNQLSINTDTLSKIAVALDVPMFALIDDYTVDRDNIFDHEIKLIGENFNLSDPEMKLISYSPDMKEVKQIICNKYENLEIFNKLFKSNILEKRYDYKFEELGPEYIAELYDFMDQMISLKINEIKYKKYSK